jgi:hypothetical protein
VHWFNIFKVTAKDRWEELSESNREELSKGLVIMKKISDASLKTIDDIDTFEDENGELLDEWPTLLDSMLSIRKSNFMATETMEFFIDKFNEELRES